MDRLKIKAFGAVAESLPDAEFEFPLYGDTEELLKHLYQSHPSLEKMKFSLAVNRQMVQGNYKLEGGEEIALLPAFSGG